MHGVHFTDILFCHMHTFIIELIILNSTNNTFVRQLMLGFIARCFSMWGPTAQIIRIYLYSCDEHP